MHFVKEINFKNYPTINNVLDNLFDGVKPIVNLKKAEIPVLMV